MLGRGRKWGGRSEGGMVEWAARWEGCKLELLGGRLVGNGWVVTTLGSLSNRSSSRCLRPTIKSDIEEDTASKQEGKLSNLSLTLVTAFVLYKSSLR